MTTIKPPCGPVEGSRESELHVFKGIPFAEAPVDRLRWAPPQPKAHWQETFAATRFGNQAQQNQSPLDGLLGGTQQEEVAPFDEDCLSLNIWTPDPDASLPVMVWIHGGAFTIGSGSSPIYNGGALASRGVVVVTVNYRLGALGFLRLTDLTDGAIPSTGTEGLQDQVLALQWVRDNIAAFGGDPNNVTTFGESAGGMSVGCVLTMPAATELHHKAIPQSGACHTASPVERANRVAQVLLECLEIDPSDTDALYAASAADLLAAQTATEAKLSAPDAPKQDRNGGMAFQPCIDGEALPSLPIERIRAGAAKGKALLVGSTLEENKLFNAMNPAVSGLTMEQLRAQLATSFSAKEVEQLIATYQQALAARGNSTEAPDLATAIGTDRMFRAPGLSLVNAQLEHHDQVFNYLFDWQTDFMGSALGACHALELGFVFGTHNAGGGAFFGAELPGADELSDAMLDAWTNFAKTGNPGGAKPVPNYGEARSTLMFGAKSRIENDPHPAEREIWESDGLADKIGAM